MIDPLKNLSLPAVLFIVGLIVLFGFIYAVNSTHAAEQLLITTNVTATTSIDIAVGNSIIPSSTLGSAHTISAIELYLQHAASVTSSGWSANLGYAPNSTSSGSPTIFWGATSNGSYDLIPSTTAAWYKISFGSGLYVPYGNNLHFKFTPGSPTGLTKIGYNAPQEDAGYLCQYNGVSWSCNIAMGNGIAAKIYTNDGTSGEEQITWKFPQNGLSTIPDPSHWVFAYSGLATSSLYYIQVSGIMTSSTVSSSEVGTRFDEPLITTLGSSESTAFPTPKSYSLTPHTIGDGDRIWDLSVRLCAEQYCFIPVASDQITVTTNYSSTIPDTAYTELAGPFDVRCENQYDMNGKKISCEQATQWQTVGWCLAPPTSTWWGSFFSADHLQYGMCRFVETMLKPDLGRNIQDFVLIPYNKIRKTLPFSMIFNSVDVAQETFSNTVSEDQATLEFDYTTALPGSSKITLLSSSTLSNLVGTTTTDQIKTVGRYITWLTFLSIVAGTILL